jgi:exosortase E/protease (VPEID-CTERM system)
VVSLEITCPPANPTAGRLTYARWVGLLALLVGEILLLTLRFDSGSLIGETGWWALPLHAAPRLLSLGLTIAAATLLFAGADLWRELPRANPSSGRPYRWWAFVPGHLAALGTFAWLTSVLLEGDLAHTSGAPGAWTIAWLVAGSLTLALWALALLSGRAWLAIFGRCWKGIVLGVLGGTGAWVAGLATDALWEPLGRGTLLLVNKLLGTFFADTVSDPAQMVVGTQAFSVSIAPQCSGYEGIGLVTAFLVVYLWLFRARFRFPAALLLLPVGATAIWLLNVVRIAALVAIGTAGWPEVALGGFHSQAGWLSFLAVSLGLATVAARTRWLTVAPATAPARPAANPTAAYLAPFAAVLLAGMVGGALSGGFDWLYPLRVLGAAGALWVFRRSYADLRGPWSWHAPALGGATFAVWLLLAPPDPAGAVDPSAALFAAPRVWAWLWLFFRVAGHVLTVPLAEELAFRGYLIRRLTASDFRSVPPGRFSWLAFVASSALFGAMHGPAWPAGTLAGMLFALALRRRGRLIDAVVAHVTANGLLAVYVLSTGRWSLWF